MDRTEDDGVLEVTATAGHPFWVPDIEEWVDAGELRPGMWVQTSSGTWVQVTAGTFATKPGMMEGKWFATTRENAEQWGAMLNAGRGLTVETRVPRSVVNQLHFTGGNLDGVGPGWYADSSLLSLINQHMDGIRVWP